MEIFKTEIEDIQPMDISKKEKTFTTKSMHINNAGHVENTGT